LFWLSFGVGQPLVLDERPKITRDLTAN
jgi:hypothetical protein